MTATMLRPKTSGSVSASPPTIAHGFSEISDEVHYYLHLFFTGKDKRLAAYRHVYAYLIEGLFERTRISKYT